MYSPSDMKRMFPLTSHLEEPRGRSMEKQCAIVAYFPWRIYLHKEINNQEKTKTRKEGSKPHIKIQSQLGKVGS
jgi:hypothetical protein